MNSFFVQSVKIPSGDNSKYKGELWQQDGERWEQIFPTIDADDIHQLLRDLGLEIEESYGPWVGEEAVHHIIKPLEADDTFDNYEVVKVELQCLRKVKND